MKEKRLRPRSWLDYMFAMVPCGTPVSVCDDDCFASPQAPLASVSVISIATFLPVLAGVSFLSPASAATALMFAAGLDGINKIPRRDQGFSTSGPTSTGSTARFSEKPGDQGEPLCC
jgi:hypothetical protein